MFFSSQNNENKVLRYESKVKVRKEARKLRNGVEKVQDSSHGQIKGFPPHSFDRVLLDPPCSALGLRPRLFAGEVLIRINNLQITFYLGAIYFMMKWIVLFV